MQPLRYNLRDIGVMDIMTPLGQVIFILAPFPQGF